MRICGSCGAANPAEDRFCSDCGVPLGSTCPSCGSTVAADKRFCGQCGTPLPTAEKGPAAPPVPATAPVSERRVCSVLFCDLVGFTPLSESRDPEEVRELLSRYFELSRTVITRYGGVVEKFIGDAVMAVWGTPVTLEGDTERAVRAALELVDAVSALGDQVGAPSLAARAGVVTGEVAVTLGATHEGMVAGDVVNTAARVQAAAGAGSVLVDGATRRLSQAGIGFDDAGDHQLKGKVEPQRLWRAVRVVSGVGGVQRVDGLEAPLTGRDPELRLIKELFHATVERRQPRLVVVSGPAGVGKSRLGWEFEKYVDGLALVTAWHRGRCLSYGDGVVFWALAEIVRQRLGIAEEDPADLATSRLDAGLDRYVKDPAERLYVGLRLGRLLGLSLPGDTGQELSREELFAGWRLWFERIAAVNPVILLVEDVQYADPGLRDFLDHLVDWARDVPIFVLAFTRSDRDSGSSTWGTGRNRTLLALDPLDRVSMNALLDALVPGMPESAMAAIAAQARGIPLFAVETVRSLIDRDIVVPLDGVYRLVADVGTLTVPDSLHGLLAARLDALEPSVRSLVADAAVLGSSFPSEALVAVSNRGEEEVKAALTDLVRREVLEISADRLSPQRGTYRFAHDMLRQVAYETLSRRDRKVRHLLVAQQLRAAFPNDGEEVVDVVARHYLDALAAVPDDPDAEALREQAVATMTRAGERALRGGAPRRAAASFAAAADLLSSQDNPGVSLAAASLAERAAAAAVAGAEWEVAVGQADRASAQYLAADDPRSAARAQVIAGQALRAWGRHREARERLTEALEVLDEHPDVRTVHALNQLGALATFGGSDDADEITNRALVLGQAIDVGPGMMAALFTSRAIWLSISGRRWEAMAMLRESALLAEHSGDSADQGIALLNLGDVLAVTDPAAAAVTARSAADLLRRSGYRDYLDYALTNLAAALLATGDWDEAARTLTETTAADGLDGDDVILNYRAFVSALRGQTDAAQSLLAGLDDLRANEALQEQALVAIAEAYTAAAAGRPADALHHARLSLRNVQALGVGSEPFRWGWPLAARTAYELGDIGVVRELLSMLDGYHRGYLPPMLHAERALVRAWLAADAAEPDADQQLTAAVAGIRDRGSPYHLAQALLDHAGYLAAGGNATEPGRLVDEAEEIARALGAAPVLARVTAVRSRLAQQLTADRS